ncbi:alpha/beta hydrolase [Singulisphaera sp. PoT]|uniref:alpha/beta hydrolase n=1 Tax=Singulisphaera sp. PoT TaxID=3411797 RepID=UPI003BF5A1E6
MRSLATFIIFTIAFAGASRADEPLTLDIWPGSAPGDDGSIGEEKVETKAADPATIVRYSNVTKPTIKVFRPAPETNSGVALIIFPGGGYNSLAWAHEGEQVAKWLNTLGVTGIVLKYRIPRRGSTAKDEPPPQALADAQRALSLVRSKAGEWGIDAAKVGILGFSAGGHLGAWLSTNYERRGYEPIDDIDKVNSRPDFAALIYPAYLLAKGTSELAKEIRVSAKTPPTFLAHAGDDRHTPENSVAYYLALKRAGVPAELHVFATGGHGFGMRKGEHPVSAWTSRCEDWLRDQKILKPAAKP